MGHRQAVIGNGDVADLSLAPGLQSGIIQAVRAPWTGTEGGVVELIDVDVVGAQSAQAGLQILPELLRRLCGGFRGQDHPVPHPGKGGAHLLLAVRIGPGCVKVVHSPVIGPVEQFHRLRLGDPLDGQTAKALLLHYKARAAQFHASHICSSS